LKEQLQELPRQRWRLRHTNQR